mgnify:CR=1 FL=1
MNLVFEVSVTATFKVSSGRLCCYLESLQETDFAILAIRLLSARLVVILRKTCLLHSLLSAFFLVVFPSSTDRACVTRISNTRYSHQYSVTPVACHCRVWLPPRRLHRGNLHVRGRYGCHEIIGCSIYIPFLESRVIKMSNEMVNLFGYEAFWTTSRSLTSRMRTRMRSVFSFESEAWWYGTNGSRCFLGFSLLCHHGPTDQPSNALSNVNLPRIAVHEWKDSRIALTSMENWFSASPWYKRESVGRHAFSEANKASFSRSSPRRFPTGTRK